MRLIVLLVVLGLTTYANAGSGSDSTSDSAEYIHIGKYLKKKKKLRT